MAHDLKKTYGTKIDEVLRASLVTKENVIFNTFYEGVATAGAVNIPVRDGEVAVGDYSVTNVGSNAVSYGSTAYITAVVDNDKYVNEYIDGYEAEAVPDNMVAQRVTSAGYSLANVEDTHAINTLLYAVQGKDKNGTAFADVRTGKTGASVTATTSVFDDIVDMGTALDNANVPQDNRWAIVTPTVYASLVKSDDFVKASDLSQELVQSGAVGMVNGVAIYKSSKLEGATAQPSTKISIIMGHANFCTRVEAWKKEPALYDGNSDANIVGGSLLKGRKVFTHEVTKPQAFAYRQ